MSRSWLMFVQDGKEKLERERARLRDAPSEATMAKWAAQGRSHGPVTERMSETERDVDEGLGMLATASVSIVLASLVLAFVGPWLSRKILGKRRER